MSWYDCSASGTDYTSLQTSAADNVTVRTTQDTAGGTAFWHVHLDFETNQAVTVQFPDFQDFIFNGGVPAPGPCEDDRPLTKDSWYCPECEHLHGRRHYKNWKDGPPYCPHCKWEGESWDKITFLEQEEIDKLNRERRWTRDD